MICVFKADKQTDGYMKGKMGTFGGRVCQLVPAELAGFKRFDWIQLRLKFIWTDKLKNRRTDRQTSGQTIHEQKMRVFQQRRLFINIIQEIM